MSEYYALVLFNEARDRFKSLKDQYDTTDHRVNEMTD